MPPINWGERIATSQAMIMEFNPDKQPSINNNRRIGLIRQFPKVFLKKTVTVSKNERESSGHECFIQYRLRLIFNQSGTHIIYIPGKITVVDGGLSVCI